MKEVLDRAIYRRQRRFFQRAYRTQEHGWPVEGPTPQVARLARSYGRGGRALDLGCGEGRHSILLAKSGCRVDAVDIEPLALQYARRFARRAGVADRIRFQVGNALSLNFADGAFDLVLDYGCFHHVVARDWPRYQREVLRVLKPGGHLVLSVFSTEFKHHEGEVRRRNWLVHRDHYDRFFTKAALVGAFRGRFEFRRILLERSGLSVFWHSAWRKPANAGPAGSVRKRGGTR